jgi:dihydrodipicolinate synthase/N-acetylneuraminate lyase
MGRSFYTGEKVTDELETVIAIPPLPFRNGIFDGEAHRKNVRYLIERNFMEGGRKRAIGIAGTSLVHHVDQPTLLEVIRVTGEAAGRDAVIIAGLVATPLSAGRAFLQQCMKMARPPEYFLLMPIPGVCNPDGIAAEFTALARDSGERLGARFMLYMRSSDLAGAYARVLADSPHIAGVKVGTREQDIALMRSTSPPDKKVLWGVGDRATQAARLGSRGHTSGITLICPRACDEIFNAYRRGDFDAAARMEEEVSEFEEIRFIQSRAYNYSAVVAAAQMAGFTDIDLGDGGPYNAAPPPSIIARLASCMERLKRFH